MTQTVTVTELPNLLTHFYYCQSNMSVYFLFNIIESKSDRIKSIFS